MERTRPDEAKSASGTQERDAAAAFVRGRDVACPGCGYNLRDSADGVCPECGRVLVLRASDDQRARRALLWLIFAWSTIMGAGPLAVSAAYWAVYRSFPGYGVEAALIAAAHIAAVSYGVIGMVTLVRTRRRSFPESRWWSRAGWVVLLGVSAQYVVALVAVTQSMFGFSLGLPF